MRLENGAGFGKGTKNPRDAALSPDPNRIRGEVREGRGMSLAIQYGRVVQ